MAAKKVKNSKGKLVYASTLVPRQRVRPVVKSSYCIDWATWQPSRKFGVHANLGTSYRHNGKTKYS
jgi:hypothetical protein